jgi:pyruvate dehydrogenase E2 component (dihydrolipoamide acetyltransferase)
MTASPTPASVGDGLAVRQVMKITLSAEHRLVDGELGARFLNAIRRRLQDVEAIRAEALNA